MNNPIVSYGLCVAGSVMSLFNFYLSFGRPLWLRYWKSVPYDQQRNVSGFPILGSLMIVIGVGMLPDISNWRVAFLVLALFDMGGLHVFGVVLLVVLCRSVIRK